MGRCISRDNKNQFFNLSKYINTRNIEKPETFFYKKDYTFSQNTDFCCFIFALFYLIRYLQSSKRLVHEGNKMKMLNFII